jgi:hypothetical protein
MLRPFFFGWLTACGSRHSCLRSRSAGDGKDQMTREVSIVCHRQRHPQIAGGDHKHDSAPYCLMMNELDPALCEYGCKRITPYGYVQNASCPRHD